VFATVCRQAGAIEVRDLEEMADPRPFRFGRDVNGPQWQWSLEEEASASPRRTTSTRRGCVARPCRRRQTPSSSRSWPNRNPIDAFISFDPARLGNTARIAEAENIDAVIVQMDFASPGFAMSPAARNRTGNRSACRRYRRGLRGFRKVNVVVAHQSLDAEATGQQPLS
jgi:hypothetical protein